MSTERPLKNPFYAGVYAYGKSEKRTTILDGRARKSYGHHKPMGTWEVFIKDHHEGYISWAEFERNQALLAGNAYGRVGDTKFGAAGAPCWPVSSAVRTAVVGSAFYTPVAIHGRSTGANNRTYSWGSGDA